MRRAAATTAITITAAALAGPDWTEVGDAGSFLTTAQTPTGVGPIQTISGSLGSEGGAIDQEDCYVLRIAEPMSFRLELLGANFDAQLFVFNITAPGGALGLLANDNANANTVNPILTATATDGTGVTIDLAGDYLIAVAGAGRFPTSDLGAIFNLADPTEISGADGPGGLLRHTGWAGQGEVGEYTIDLEGLEFADIPTPGTLAALALTAGLTTRRRRG